MKIEKSNKYLMYFCNVEKKMKAHKVFYKTELQGLKVRHYASILCVTCQRGLISAYMKAGRFQ